MSTIAEISIFPIGEGESVSSHVAEAVKVIEQSGLDYLVGPMGTCIEGEWERVMKVVTDCMNAMKKNSGRVYMTLKVDHREGAEGRLRGKLDSLDRAGSRGGHPE